jgi:hypothetical protein
MNVQSPNHGCLMLEATADMSTWRSGGWVHSAVLPRAAGWCSHSQYYQSRRGQGEAGAAFVALLPSVLRIRPLVVSEGTFDTKLKTSRTPPLSDHSCEPGTVRELAKRPIFSPI